MIANIGNGNDITVYFSIEEIERLREHNLSGVLVNLNNPSHNGEIYVCFDDEKRRYARDFVLSFGKLKQSTGVFCVYLDSNVYFNLTQHGKSGARYGHIGSKISLRDRARLDGLEKMSLEYTESLI